jgi:hypothetical protein
MERVITWWESQMDAGLNEDQFLRHIFADSWSTAVEPNRELPVKRKRIGTDSNVQCEVITKDAYNKSDCARYKKLGKEVAEMGFVAHINLRSNQA